MGRLYTKQWFCNCIKRKTNRNMGEYRRSHFNNFHSWKQM